MSEALVATAHGVYAVDLEEDAVIGLVDEAAVVPPAAESPFPRTIAAAEHGSLVVVVVDRRPPLLVSADAGITWTESGGGLPAGRAVAISPDDPDRVLYAGRNRLYLSRDGGRFWTALTAELPEIEAVAFAAEA